MLAPEPTFPCVECGGTCHLLTHPNEDGTWEPGEIVAYRCADCLERFDIELYDPALDPDDS